MTPLVDPGQLEEPVCGCGHPRSEHDHLGGCMVVDCSCPHGRVEAAIAAAYDWLEQEYRQLNRAADEEEDAGHTREAMRLRRYATDTKEGGTTALRRVRYELGLVRTLHRPSSDSQRKVYP